MNMATYSRDQLRELMADAREWRTVIAPAYAEAIDCATVSAGNAGGEVAPAAEAIARDYHIRPANALRLAKMVCQND